MAVVNNPAAAAAAAAAADTSNSIMAAGSASLCITAASLTDGQQVKQSMLSQHRWFVGKRIRCAR
jgi:hypothetical protein